MKQIYLPNSNAQVRTFRRALLTGVEITILDEIHAVVGNRRGVHLITAVDRLVRLSGEFQRIALSATVRRLEKVAEFIGGLQVTGAGPEPRYSPRAVATVRSTDAKRYEIQDSADGNARKVSADTGADAASGQVQGGGECGEAYHEVRFEVVRKWISM